MDRKVLVASAIGVGLLVSPALAVTHRVPSEHPTIQAAMDMSVLGDTVLVAPGTYTDWESRNIGTPTAWTACVFMVDGVTLLSESGPSATIIDMQQSPGPQAFVIIARYQTSGESRIEGFTITGARVGRGGVYTAFGELVTFRDCVFRDNGLMKLPGARELTQVFLGVHRKRQLPAFAHDSFPAWFARHRPAGDGHRGPVLLFHDEFMDYNYPQTGIAVTEILEKAGYAVELFHGVCCGRPMISKGLEGGASVCAIRNVPLLYEAASRGAYIVGCEPSCLLTLRDEYLHLVPEPLQEKARVVAGRALLIDEFLMMLHEKGALELQFKPQAEPPRALFHGHCHQKAFANVSKSLDLLGVAGYDVDFVNAACCGMAGMYGFEKEHYEASRDACERAVLPAVRARPDAALVIMGVSCRQQIEHFSGRPARHLVEAVRDALA